MTTGLIRLYYVGIETADVESVAALDDHNLSHLALIEPKLSTMTSTQYNNLYKPLNKTRNQEIQNLVGKPQRTN